MGNSSSCHVETKPADPNTGLFHDGELTIKAHQVGFIISGGFALIAIASSVWLIRKHLMFYTYPSQQRYIVRILFMVPIYAVMSWLSYFWWQQSIYFALIRDCYEAVVIASFFYLLLAYLGDTPDQLRDTFRQVKLKKWMWPMGFIKYRPANGLVFLHICKWMIGQYVVIRPASTLAAVVTEATGTYCVFSWSPVFSHVWIVLFVSISVSIAMYGVLQLYMPLKAELEPYKPMLKFFAVKAVVFLTFWQETLLAVLAWAGVIKESRYWTAEQINVGLSAILQCFEMACFGLFHVKAFSYLPYRPDDVDPVARYAAKSSKRLALLHVLDFRDVVSEVAKGSVTIGKALGGRPLEGDRHDDLEGALGTTRLLADAHRIADHREERRRVSAASSPGMRRTTNEIEADLKRIRMRALDAAPEATYAEIDGTRRGDDEDDDGDAHRYRSLSAELGDEGMAYEVEKRQAPAQYELRGRKEGRSARRPLSKPSWWQTLRGRFAAPTAPPSPAPEDEMEEKASVSYDPPILHRPLPAEMPSYTSDRPPRPPLRVVMPDPLSPSRYPRPPTSAAPSIRPASMPPPSSSRSTSSAPSASSGRPQSAIYASAYPKEAPLPSICDDLVGWAMNETRRNSAGIGAHGARSPASTSLYAASTQGPYTEWRRPPRRKSPAASPRYSPSPGQGQRGFVFEEY